jgi:hypothetical protein
MRLAPLALFLSLLGSCGSATQSSSVHVAVLQVSHARATHVTILHPGQKASFPAGAFRPGDLVVCTIGGHRLRVRIPNRPSGSWSIGTGSATPGGKGGELQVSSTPSGSVSASCS